MRAVVDPARVKPEALEELANVAGPSLFVSDYLIANECLRLVALSGLRAAVPGDVTGALRQQERWMLRLGRMSGAA